MVRDVTKGHLSELTQDELAAVADGWHDAAVAAMEIMPRIMGPFMSGMLSVVPAEKMVEKKEQMFTRILEQRPELREKIPARQMEMMPGCMRRLMENISYEEKLQYAEHVVGILVEKGGENLTPGERSTYLARLRAAVPETA